MQAQISLHISAGWSGPSLSAYSKDTLVYVDKHKMPRLDCTGGHAILDQSCPQIAYVLFLCVDLHLFVLEAPHRVVTCNKIFLEK